MSQQRTVNSFMKSREPRYRVDAPVLCMPTTAREDVTPPLGVFIFDSTTKELFTGDGVTSGGVLTGSSKEEIRAITATAASEAIVQAQFVSCTAQTNTGDTFTATAHCLHAGDIVVPMCSDGTIGDVGLTVGTEYTVAATADANTFTLTGVTFAADGTQAISFRVKTKYITCTNQTAANDRFTSAAHGLKVGNVLTCTDAATCTKVTAGIKYTVSAVASSTTFTLTDPNGTAVAIDDDGTAAVDFTYDGTVDENYFKWAGASYLRTGDGVVIDGTEPIKDADGTTMTNGGTYYIIKDDTESDGGKERSEDTYFRVATTHAYAIAYTCDITVRNAGTSVTLAAADAYIQGYESIIYDTPAVAHDVYLPDAAVAGNKNSKYTIQRTTAAFDVTVKSVGGTVNGAAAGTGYVLSASLDIAADFISDGTNWIMTTSNAINNLMIGTSASPYSLTTYANKAVAIYTTCPGTDGSNSVEPLYIKSVIAGIGQVGGRSRFHCYTNVAAGGWINALKGYMEFGASGRTTGLASAVCAEVVLSAGTSAAAYCALEAELVLGTGALTGERTSFIYCNASGADASTFDTNGYFLHVGNGITAAAGKFCSANYHTLKCFFTDSSTTRYMVLSETEDGVGLGTSGSPMTVTYNGTKPLSVYTTCASTDASTSYEPVYFGTTMTGAGQVGGRVKMYMTTNVALGGWSNASKSEVVYGASGSTTGLGSVHCMEMTLSAGTSAGTYATCELELNVPTGASLGTKTSFVYASVNGADAATFDTGGLLLNIQGFTSAAGKFILVDGDEPTWNENTVYIKCLAGATTFYLIGCTNQAVD